MALIGLNGLELELGRTNNHLIDCRLSNLIATVGFEKCLRIMHYIHTYYKYYYGRPQKKLFTLYHEERHFHQQGQKFGFCFHSILLFYLYHYYY